MRLLRSILFLAFVPLAAASSAHAAPADGCPGESSTSRERVRQFLAATHLAEVRDQLGLRTATPQDVRALRGPADASVCRSLRAALAHAAGGRVPPGHLALFASGGFYFAAVDRPTASHAGYAHIREDSSVMFVFDREFRLVSRLLA